VARLWRLSFEISVPGAALPASSTCHSVLTPARLEPAHPGGRRASPARLLAALAIALSLHAAESRAQEAVSPLAGTWSKDLDTCSLSDDEDETRFVIEPGEIKDYGETCRILNQSARQDRSLILSLQCPSARQPQIMRVFRKSADSAVFYLPENKRPRSRDVMRCPPSLPDLPLTGAEGTEPWSSIREPRRLIKMWLDARQRCRSQVSASREEACTERRQIGALLRSMRLCHYTRGSREGWRSC
jgi:hypothetical protein